MVHIWKLTSREEALHRWLEAVPAGPLASETLPWHQALGRVLTQAVVAPHPLPAFPRSSVDGYAVRAADVRGAGPETPVSLAVKGELFMGSAPTLAVAAGEAVLIHTGGVIPEGADAVVMLEDTRPVENGLEVLRAVAPGENIIPVGADVQTGEVVMAPGHILRPQELGGLAAYGVLEVQVARRPRLGVMATGDELVPPKQMPGPNQVRDVNSTSITALLRLHGAEATGYGIIPDDFSALVDTAAAILEVNDGLVISAGGSVSDRDMTARVIEALGAPGVLVRGVAIQPGRPTTLAVCNGKPVIGLPGNPVSALVSGWFFLRPLVWHLQGTRPPRVGEVRARLLRGLGPTGNRERFVPVRLHDTETGLLAEPVEGASNLIFNLVRSGGLLPVPASHPPLPEGTEVTVWLW